MVRRVSGALSSCLNFSPAMSNSLLRIILLDQIPCFYNLLLLRIKWVQSGFRVGSDLHYDDLGPSAGHLATQQADDLINFSLDLLLDAAFSSSFISSIKLIHLF